MDPTKPELTEEPEVETPAATPPPEDDGFMALTLQDLEDAIKPPPEKKIEAAPEPKVEKVETPPALVPEKAKPVAVVKTESVQDVVQREIARHLPTVNQTPPPVKEIPKVDDPLKAPEKDPFEDTLGEEEQEEIELARQAEKLHPDKYKGFASRNVEYLKKTTAYLEKARQENPDRTFGPDDTEFQKFKESNKPRWEKGDRSKVQRESILQEAAKIAEEKHKAEFDDIKRRQRAVEIKPEVDRTISQYQTNLRSKLSEVEDGKESTVASIAKFISEKGFEAAETEYPIYAKIVQDVTRHYESAGQTFINLTSGLASPVNFDSSLPMNHPQNLEAARQQFVIQYIHDQGEQFEQHGGDARNFNGKTFSARHRYFRLTEAEKAKHWTMDDSEILGMLQLTARMEAQRRVEDQEKLFTKAGYTRAKPAPLTAVVKKAEIETETPASPKTPVSSAPGAGKRALAPTGALFNDDELRLLGLPV